jgi:hypothetical protein
MKLTAIPVLALMMVLCVLASGCTSGTAPASTPVPSPASTPAPATTVIPATAAPVATATDAGDGPINLPPTAQQVNLELTKDRPTSELHLLFQGGPGERFAQKITMRVYSADNTFTDYMMSGGQRPIPGNEIVAPGTRGGDRCVVFLMSGGVTYKVIDKKVFSEGL